MPIIYFIASDIVLKFVSSALENAMTKLMKELLLLTALLISLSSGGEVEVEVVGVQSSGTLNSIEFDQEHDRSSRAFHQTSSHNKSLVQEDAELKSKDQTHSHNPYQCSVYMAQSGIPHAGFGIYTVRDVKKGEALLPYSDAPAIPICNGGENGIEATDWNHVDYLWSGAGLAEFECEYVSMSVMNFGAIS